MIDSKWIKIQDEELYELLEELGIEDQVPGSSSDYCNAYNTRARRYNDLIQDLRKNFDPEGSRSALLNMIDEFNTLTKAAERCKAHEVRKFNPWVLKKKNLPWLFD